MIQGNAVHRDTVVIGASAGGVAALRDLVSSIPADFPASILVVVHTAPKGVSHLAEILDRAGPLPARFAEDGEAIRAGHLYVAPPDRHLLVRDGHLHLSRGPKENRTRPAVNPLFRSAALSRGPRVVGAVLTGMLDNGTAGLLAVERAGGTTIVQDPEDAAFPGMPASALEFLDPDYTVQMSELPALLARLTRPPAAAITPAPEEPPGRIEELVMDEIRDTDTRQRVNTASGFTCPECQGALWEIAENGLVEFICRIGHMFGPETLMDEQAHRRDDLLESALRALREETALTTHLVERGRERGLEHRRLKRHVLRIQELERTGDLLEKLIRDGGPPPSDSLHAAQEGS
jgi:two-component system chemotaxis response regulator CheB